MKNLNKIKLLFLCVFINYNALSQSNGTYPKVELIKGDTVVVFSIEQSKKLATINETKKSLEKINEIQVQELLVKDSIIGTQSIIISDLEKIKKNNEIIISEKNKLEQLYIEQNKILTTEVKKQKRYKWYAIITAATTTFFWISK
jgi:hypothetical protein